QNYDEFAVLQALQDLDINDLEAVEKFKTTHYLNDEGFNKMFEIKIPSQRVIQDYKSTYNDIREWIIRGKNSKNKDELTIDWNDIVFEIDLLKSQEINLDYILELI